MVLHNTAAEKVISYDINQRVLCQYQLGLADGVGLDLRYGSSRSRDWGMRCCRRHDCGYDFSGPLAMVEVLLRIRA